MIGIRPPAPSLKRKLLAAALLLTLAMLALRPWLPQREFAVLPAPDDPQLYLSQVPAGVASTTAWLDRKHYRFQCHKAEGAKDDICTVSFFLPRADLAHGVDLSGFDGLRFKVQLRTSATGPAAKSTHVRVGLRNFDPRFSTEKDGNSAKFNNVHLSMDDLQGTLYLRLAEFNVPEWWTSMFELPRDVRQTDFRNATLLTIETLSTPAGTTLEMAIEDATFVGEWISAEQLYLVIICAWILGGGAFAIGELLQLRRQEQQRRQQIRQLQATNQTLEQEKDRFRKLSTVDALTNTFNRHGIELVLNALDLHHKALGVIMVDLDHFKAINDQHGHDVGDRVLQRVGQLLVENTRAGAQVGRWGGEEFILICPDTSTDTAVRLAERLRQRIELEPFGGPQALTVTASFGVASLHPPEVFTQTVKRADQALYRAKSQGRNQVVNAEAGDGNSDAPPAPAG